MKYDFIVVGHGLSGAILSYTLRKRGHRVLVIDEPRPSSASRVAAGLLNPVAGKRFAKSWLADAFIPAADAFYQELGAHFGRELYRHKPIYKIFSTIEEQNTWMAKCASEGWQEYILETYTQGGNQPAVQEPYGGILIGRGGSLLVAEMLDLLTTELVEKGLLLPERFEMDQLQLTAQGVQYKDVEADHLIFCEGFQVVDNPYFKWLPIQPTKGEVLEIAAENFNPDCIYNKAVYVVPVGEGRFRVGATYNWRQPDEQPTEAGRQELEERFSQITPVPFTTINHLAGIRPAVRDRKPLVGTHPQHTQLSVFNGMGSKGVQMAPLLAQQFAAALAGEAELMPDIRISRYLSLYYDYLKHQNSQL